MKTWFWAAAVGLVLGSMVDGSFAGEGAYGPSRPPTHLFWGDPHLHTRRSVDAYSFGNRNLTLQDAYDFAEGKAVKVDNGMTAQLRRPLDFLVVADHAENLNVMAMIGNADPDFVKTPKGQALRKEWRKIEASAGTPGYAKRKFGFFNRLLTGPIVGDEKLRHTVWEETAEAADENNHPGRFTAFVGYEWSSPGRQGGGNLHRVVIFRNSAKVAERFLPFSALDSVDPEDLWRHLERYEQETGGQVLAIPHNGNLSKGEMFALTDFTGRPLSREYAMTRSAWEPIYEVTQMKGDGETHPLLSPTDEFADYETWNSWAGRPYGSADPAERLKRKKGEYARAALKTGLDEYAKLGVNPFKFGMIGGTDSHTSLSTPEENNFWGKMTVSEPSATRMTSSWVEGAPGAVSSSMAWQLSASGYAAVWATGNTRAALFDAMKRKEVYATTGPRIRLRFFGGWDYEASAAFSPDLAEIGYKGGVPMGGDLTAAPRGKAPRFLIRATKDPIGANLDRIQVVKGWRDTNGKLHEKIYNVALSDGRREDANGAVPDVGSTVNVKEATYTNSIGDPELAVVWRDPDFKADDLAFYYVRVIEIPTPRWTAYDAHFFKLKNLPKDIPMVTRERAYSSPIWYTP